MLERFIHWIGKSRKKKCKSCCLRCEYWELRREEEPQAAAVTEAIVKAGEIVEKAFRETGQAKENK